MIEQVESRTVKDDARARSSEPRVGRYETYVVVTMALAFALNFMDRGLIGVLNEPIRRAFHLGDFQMGLLAGPAFGILYTVLGLPLARLSERTDRRLVISLALSVWSVLTALSAFVGLLNPALQFGIFVLSICPIAILFLRERLWVGFTLVTLAVGCAGLLLGVATAGWVGFALLFMCRVGVGIGEAGCYPAASSLIGDYIPVERRAAAFSLFTAGGTIGGMLAAGLGGPLADSVGWRLTLILLGLPGILAAMLIFTTVKEPSHVTRLRSGFSETLRYLWSRRTFRHIALGSTIASFALYGVNQFLFAFLARAYGLSTSRAAVYVIFMVGAAVTAGIICGGLLTTRFSSKVPTMITRVPGIGLIAATPLLIVAIRVSSPGLMFVAYAGGSFLLASYASSISAITQNLVASDMRATAAAVLAFVIALGGVSLGPPAIGLASDFLASEAFQASAHASYETICLHGGASNSGCDAARLAGLRHALEIFACGLVWAGVHYLRAGRSLVEETVAPTATSRL